MHTEKVVNERLRSTAIKKSYCEAHRTGGRLAHEVTNRAPNRDENAASRRAELVAAVAEQAPLTVRHAFYVAGESRPGTEEQTGLRPGTERCLARRGARCLTKQSKTVREQFTDLPSTQNVAEASYELARYYRRSSWKNDELAVFGSVIRLHPGHVLSVTDECGRCRCTSAHGYSSSETFFVRSR